MKKITNLLVVPLIASAVFLAGPALASNSASNSMRVAKSEVRNVTSEESIPNTRTRKGIVGKVTSISGNIIIVTSKNTVQYTVDAANATIMKASDQLNTNPSIVDVTEVKVGDAIMVRGVIKDTEISASKIFDGKKLGKHARNLVGKKMHGFKNKRV